MDSIFSREKPFILAGPCSAESYDQLAGVASQLSEMGIKAMRAGSWKPRSRPDTFEGKGVKALQWLQQIRQEFKIQVATEIASPYHVEQALKYEIDIFWIGARTSVNPFVVQEISESLDGVSQPVMVKNPINPDLSLWLGSIERIEKKANDVAAVHRGFSSYQPSRFRNIPLWQIPLELKRLRGDLPLICDPSHIAGKRDMVAEIAQKSMDLNYDGLMIEVHPDPPNALSDPDQQITPDDLVKLIQTLEIRSESFTDPLILDILGELRDKIDIADKDLIESLSVRMKLVEQIGDYKKENNVAVFQLERWKEILSSRPEWAKSLGLSSQFIEDLYKIIHEESIRIQSAINAGNETK